MVLKKKGKWQRAGKRRQKRMFQRRREKTSAKGGPSSKEKNTKIKGEKIRGGGARGDLIGPAKWHRVVRG